MADGRELVPTRFDVSEQVRRILNEFEPHADGELNRFTPRNMRSLVSSLERLTDELHEEDETRRLVSISPGGPIYDECDQMCVDLQRWEARLSRYRAALNAVPANMLNDRKVVLWTVAAPLFFGWYGGEDGKGSLPDDALPPGFDPDIQHPPDLATPFSLANQFEIESSFQVSLTDEIVKEARRRAKQVGDVASDAASGFAMLGIGVAGIALAVLIASRR